MGTYVNGGNSPIGTWQLPAPGPEAGLYTPAPVNSGSADRKGRAVTTTASPRTPLPGNFKATVPRWAVWAAHAVPLTALPSGLWRLALGAGIPVGFHGEMAELYAAPGWITLYVIVLSAIAEGLALLTLGLVQPWGEVVPRWIPFLGGRTIPVMAAVVPAALGALAVTFFSVMGVQEWIDPDMTQQDIQDSPNGVAGVIMTVAYAPMLAWGPLLGVVTVAYHLRRRQQVKGTKGTA